MLRTVPALLLLALRTLPAAGPIREAWAPAFNAIHVPGFYNGYLYFCEPGGVLTLFAPDGQELFSLPFEGHSNGLVGIESIAVDSNRILAVAWQDRPNAGIDIRDLSGKLIRTIDTGFYIPAHLAFDTHHSLWALGWQRDAKDPMSSDRGDYPIVREYSIDGKEIRASLQRWLFRGGLSPGSSGWQSRGISVTADRVGIEAISGDVSNQLEWVELDLTGNLTGRWTLGSQNQSSEVAFTNDDQAYIYRYNPDADLMQLFRLNRKTSAWDLVPSLGTGLDWLYGADGDKLVFTQRHDGARYLSWYRQP